MAQLVLINEKSYTDNDDRKIGDIVAVFDDNHIFSEKEYDIFDIITVSESKEIIEEKIPDMQIARKLNTTEWTLDIPEEKQVWKDINGNWNEIMSNPRFILNYKNGVISDNISTKINNNSTIIEKTIKPIEEPIKIT